MKKILSLVFVVAMIFSLVATANAENENSVYLTYAQDKENKTLTIEAYVNVAEEYKGVQFYYNATELLAAGATKTSMTNHMNGQVNVVNQAAKKMILATGKNVDETWSGLNKVATFVFDISNVDAGTYNIVPQADSSSTRFKVTAADGVSVMSGIAQHSLAVVIEGDAPAGPNWAKLDNVTVVEFESDADAEAGYAYAVDYAVEKAAAMIFAIDDAEKGRAYSTEYALDGVSGAVKAGFLSDKACTNVGVLFRDADKANIWYSLDVDKH